MFVKYCHINWLLCWKYKCLIKIIFPLFISREFIRWCSLCRRLLILCFCMLKLCRGGVVMKICGAEQTQMWGWLIIMQLWNLLVISHKGMSFGWNVFKCISEWKLFHFQFYFSVGTWCWIFKSKKCLVRVIFLWFNPQIWNHICLV